MVGMGACASYKSPRPWQHYGQVVLILGERGSLLSSLGEWREALSRKSVILVAAVKTDADWKEGLRAVEEGLGRSLTASFRLSREIFSKMPSKRRGTSKPCVRSLWPMKKPCRLWKIFSSAIIRAS